jgi:hypothetical protein
MTSLLRLFTLLLGFAFCHDIFELRPQGLDGGDFVADLVCVSARILTRVYLKRREAYFYDGLE